MKLAVLNFSYGANPHLRTTEIALAVNKELAHRGEGRLGLILPWIYGEKQRSLLLEEFKEHHTSDIHLDPELGEILQSVLYGNGTYMDSLDSWIHHFESKSEEARDHLSGKIRVQDLQGNSSTLEGDDIVFELARSPRLLFHTSPSINVTFGHTSEVLKQALELPSDICNIDREPTKKATVIAEAIERHQALHIMAQPGTFYTYHQGSAHDPSSEPGGCRLRLPEANTGQ